MENSDASGVSSVPAQGAVRSHRMILIAVVVVAAVVVTIGACFAAGLFSKPAGQDSFLFKGAYARYGGSTSMSVLGYSVEFAFSAKLEVLDYNSTHAYIRTSATTSSSESEPIENVDEEWVELSTFDFMSGFSDTTLTDSYEANVNVGNLGTRNCIVYEYATDGPTMTVYVDKALKWPLKMTMSMDTGGFTGPLSLDITLEATNIPALR